MKASLEHVERLFGSKDTRDLIEFYGCFEDRDDLLSWMKNRPKASIRVVEEFPAQSNRDDVIVVIATADVNGRFARNCVENVFRGMKIVLVESNGQYFNVDRSINAGIEHAMQLNPKWIVSSADDVIKVDEPEVLGAQLSKMDHKKFDSLFLNPPGVYHSFPGKYGKESYSGQFIRSLFQYHNLDTYHIMKRLQSHSWIQLPDFKSMYADKNQDKMEGRRPWLIPIFLKAYSPFVRSKFTCVQARSIGIFSYEYVKEMNGKIADEIFVNSCGDIDVSVQVAKRNRYAWIDYKIKTLIGASLGGGRLRKLKDIAGEIYLDYKLSNGLI